MANKISLTTKALGFAATISLTGCAFVPVTVHPIYMPTKAVMKVPGAKAVTVSVTVQNLKKHPKVVSMTLNSFGVPVSPVYMHVSKDFYTAFTRALEARGFTVTKDSKTKFTASVIHFYMKEQQHFLAPSHTVLADIKVMISNQGKVIFAHDYVVNTKYQQKGVAVTSIGRQKSAEIAMNKIVNKIVSDPRVIGALFKAAGKTPPSLDNANMNP